jgi:hypothetical protein
MEKIHIKTSDREELHIFGDDLRWWPFCKDIIEKVKK